MFSPSLFFDILLSVLAFHGFDLILLFHHASSLSPQFLSITLYLFPSFCDALSLSLSRFLCLAQYFSLFLSPLDPFHSHFLPHSFSFTLSLSLSLSDPSFTDKTFLMNDQKTSLWMPLSHSHFNASFFPFLSSIFLTSITNISSYLSLSLLMHLCLSPSISLSFSSSYPSYHYCLSFQYILSFNFLLFSFFFYIHLILFSISFSVYSTILYLTLFTLLSSLYLFLLLFLSTISLFFSYQHNSLFSTGLFIFTLPFIQSFHLYFNYQFLSKYLNSELSSFSLIIHLFFISLFLNKNSTIKLA
ncbi:unnamed protein product [Acanthosepion pharaonis]|uniref:Uncharacterized protein n=1 Tax=Acanthosepion pharaonis TaxID=158019 RepID=A0A812C755_ACAPH|nr:unnamed protein product [Sepia pharaonis]